MKSIRNRGAALLVALALVGPAATVVSPTAAQPPKAVAAHSCSAGYTHAALSWGHKCLRAGQFCKRGKNHEYHRYGYHCKANGHLRRW